MKKFFFVAIAATALLGACNKPGEVKVDENLLKTQADTLSYAIGQANSFSEQEIINAFQQFGIDSTKIDDFYKGLEAALKAGDDKLAYQLGYMQGVQTKLRNGQYEQMAFDKKMGEKAKKGQAFNNNLIILGIMDGIKDKSGLVIKNTLPTGEVINDTIKGQAANAFVQSYVQQISANNSEFIKTVKANGAKEFENGIFYKVIKVGTGDAPKAGAMAMVSIDFCDEDGKVLQSMPSQEMPLDQIPGGGEVRKDGVIEIYVPAAKSQGSGNIIQRLTVIAINEQAAAPAPAPMQ